MADFTDDEWEETFSALLGITSALVTGIAVSHGRSAADEWSHLCAHIWQDRLRP